MVGWELFFFAGLIFVLDQVCKLFVRRLPVGRSVQLGWLKIRHLPGSGWSPWCPRLGLLFLWGLLLAGIILMIQSGHFFQHPLAQAALGAALGGAAGNLSDRFRYRGVIDFVDVGWWPVFNFADAAITLGAIASLWLIR
jgi:signal peptidase II